MTNEELLEAMENQINRIDYVVLEYTHALNAHDMSRRAVIPPDNRNELAGDVYRARQALESILSNVRHEIQERRKICREE